MEKQAIAPSGQSVYVKQWEKTKRRNVKRLLDWLRQGLISIELFNALTGKTPEYYINDIGEKEIEEKEELLSFVENLFSFEDGSVAPISKAYEMYLEYSGYSAQDAMHGKALSRPRFTRMVIRQCDIKDKVARIEGKPSRCFAGVRLLSLDDIATD